MRWMRPLIKLSILLLLCGCSGVSRNVIPGDSDYPVENRNPRAISIISGTVPTELNVSFVAYYGANEDRERLCAYYENGYLRFEGAPRWFSITEPLVATQRDGRYSFSVVSDRYLPGRCNWALRGIRMHVAGGVSVPIWIFNSRGDATTGRRMDMWCKKSRYSKMQDQPAIECSYFNEQFRDKLVQPSSLAIGQEGGGHLELNIHFLP